MARSATSLDLLLEISELFRVDMARAFEGTALTTARTHLLWVLADMGPSTQQALADAMRVSARNITGLVDALEDAGFVRRAPHPGDRRATIVSLTEVGETTMSDMARDHESLSRELLLAVEPGDRDGFTRGLDAIATHLRALVQAGTDAAGTVAR